ncbi:MAG: hypothetical protein Q7K21_00810 [Elusimicrobiota bacterium]|nr:hypothetical protein [Elusimicrobiota bacterium]
MNSAPWKAIFDKYKIGEHNFNKEPFIITAQQIRDATRQHFKKTNEIEARILCKQDSRENRPDVFIENNLFILPVKNKIYIIVKGEGYVDIPLIKNTVTIHKSKLDFQLDTSKIGNSEMQHLDFAYASSIIRTFMNDDSLVLTIRGRKYTPQFSFNIGKQLVEVDGVQTEVDAGYEGKNKVVLIEAKNSKTDNVIIRQLFYPFRQWSRHTKKDVLTLFFEKQSDNYLLWQFQFTDKNDYNSIQLAKTCKFQILE